MTTKTEPFMRQKETIYKAIAITGFLLMTVTRVYVLTFGRSEFVIALTTGTGIQLVWAWVSCITNFACWICFAYLMFRPLQLLSFWPIPLAYAILDLIETPGYFMGPLMFALCMTMLYVRGFFTKAPVKKLCLLTSLFLAATFTQLRFGMGVFVKTALDTLGHLLVMCLIFILFIRRQTELIWAANARLLNLLEYPALTERDRIFVKRILNGEKYEVIARGYGISVATMRNRMGFVYHSIGVADQVELLAKYGGYTVITTPEELSEWYKRDTECRQNLLRNGLGRASKGSDDSPCT